MIGVKKTEYTLLNNEIGQAFKRRFIAKYDIISVEETEGLIVISVGETFDTNDYMFV